MLSVTTILTQRKRTWLLMLAGVIAVVLLGIGDAHRQSTRALRELGREHGLLASSLSGLGDRELVQAVHRLEASGRVAVLLREAGSTGFRLGNGKQLASPELDLAFQTHAPSAMLPRSMATTLGLGARTAVAGLAPRTRSAASAYDGVVVVESAAAERDRARHAEWRSVLSVLVVSLLIVGFGLFALRRQGRENALEQQVRLQRLESARDAELSRADRMATMAALGSGFAHEIATPLSVIVGRVEQLRAGLASDARSARFLDAIASQTEYIERVIRGFLALTRGDSPALARCSAIELCERAAELVRHRFVHARVSLSIEARGAEGAFVACDATLFGQALVNLLINALEASTAGAAVTLKVARVAGLVEFSVIDQGHGMQSAAIERVTEPFFTTKRDSGGSGLGLAIVKEITHHHRGQLSLTRRAELEGEHARGMRISVRLPLEQESP